MKMKNKRENTQRDIKRKNKVFVSEMSEWIEYCLLFSNWSILNQHIHRWSFFSFFVLSLRKKQYS